ncbi:MAG: hypothetical protein LBQ15_00705 [Clostridium sp.]|jgi:hypothetical protein|nr:hypothetical protein [Clostridium sp.]
MRFYRRANFIQLLLGTLLATGLRFVLARFFLLGPEGETDSLCQLYFGGLPISASFDLVMVSLQLAVVAVEVVLLNEEIMTGIFDNLELLLCRAARKRGIFGDLFALYLFHALFVTGVGYLGFLAVEGCRPAAADMGILLSEVGLILVLACLYLILRCLLKNSLAYLGVLLIYVTPILLTGFLYGEGKGGWVNGKYFLLNDLIYNYTHGLELRYPAYGYTFLPPVLDLGTVSVGAEILARCAVLLLFAVLGGKLFQKYSVI